MSAGATGELVRFRGSPTRVEGPIGIPYDRSIARLTLAAHIDTAPPIVLLKPNVQSSLAGPGITRFVLRLPEATPAGAYSGTLQVGHDTYPIEVIVESRRRLSLMPGSTSLSAAPGHEEAVELTAINRGNMACEVPQRGRAFLFDSESLGRAVAAALSPREKGQERVNHFVDTMASHYEVLNLVVEEGSGAIQPGEIRHLTTRLQVPKGLQAGHTYSGVWELPDVHYAIEIYVPAELKEVIAS